MAEWVRLCSVEEAPAEGAVCERSVGGRDLCLARVGSELKAVDKLCPHRQGPLSEGWIEGNDVVCPWHSWAFDLTTGKASYPEGERVAAFALRVDGGDVLVDLDS